MTATARTSSPPSLLEYFTLARASEEGTKLGGPRRKEVADALSVGRQRGEAAETLWSNGHTAEGLRLAFSSLEDTLEAAALLSEPGAAKVVEPVKDAALIAASAEPTVTPDDATEAPSDATTSDAQAVEPVALSPEPPKEETLAPTSAESWRAVLLSRGVRPAKIERVASAVVEARSAKLPTLDADVSPSLAELFPRVMAARHLVDAAIAPSAWSPNEIRWTRTRRVTGVALALIASIVAAYFGLHDPEGTFTSASDVWAQSTAFGTDMAVDGRPETAWLLSDRTTGWLEVRTSPARRVERVVLTNTSNAPAHDRGTQDYRLEIYAHGELARSIDGHFDWSETPQPVTHEIGMDGVDRVRFVVESFHRTGAGLAEMDIQ